MMNPNIHELAEKANNLPLLPGVYIMYDQDDTVIYVGKAKKLKNRVTSYFHGEHLPKVEAMVQKVDHFNVIVAGSEFEALVLENSLIKKYKPHYNILLKDDKGYPFIAVDMTREYPTISLASHADAKGVSYYGPFAARKQSHEIVEAISKTLQLPTCSLVFPRDIGKTRPCINYQLGVCKGWCRRDSTAEEYQKAIAQARMILEGKTDSLCSELRSEMEQAAEELHFEKAADLRDRIRSIERLTIKQRVLATAFADTDAIGFFRAEKTCFTVLHFVDGNLAGKDVIFADNIIGEDDEIISEFLLTYYSQHRGGWPKSILIPVMIEEAEDMEKLLSEEAGRRIYIAHPQKGEKTLLTQSAMMNAEEEQKRALNAQEHRLKTLQWLQENLQLPTLPRRIESFDISNLGNTGIVSGMAVFVDGKPKKKDYRRFRLTEIQSQNDYESMFVTVTRRYTHLKEGDTDFGERPDLVLIDGGMEHAAMAVKALEQLGLTLPVFGMVKDDRHRTRALITPEGREIGIVKNQNAFSLIGNIQEETHNNAIGYQKMLRKEALQTELEQIPGVGEKRRKDLIRAFKSFSKIRNAEISELNLVVPVHVAKSIYMYYHKDTNSTEGEQK